MEQKIDTIDKKGFTFSVETLWGKIKSIIPTKTSQITNDSGFINESQVNILTEQGFGNLRYYNKKLQYYDSTTKSWSDIISIEENSSLLTYKK